MTKQTLPGELRTEAMLIAITLLNKNTSGDLFFFFGVFVEFIFIYLVIYLSAPIFAFMASSAHSQIPIVRDLQIGIGNEQRNRVI
jgi:hypothetical protein